MSRDAMLNDLSVIKYSLAELITDRDIFGTSNVYEVEINNRYLEEKEKKIFVLQKKKIEFEN